MPSLAIVIVNYNTRELLAECLRSIFANRTGELLVHTIVVDNSSSDGSAAVVRAKFPEATLIESGGRYELITSASVVPFLLVFLVSRRLYVQLAQAVSGVSIPCRQPPGCKRPLYAFRLRGCVIMCLSDR